MKETTAEWIAKAETDFSAASFLLERSEAEIVDAVCFHCQQCAEKYLKGYLGENGLAFPKEHPLAPLINLAHAFDSEFEILSQYSERLENYSVAIRYPGTSATRTQAKSALAAVVQIRTFIRRKLNLAD